MDRGNGMDMCFTCCPIELAALSCMLDRGNGMDADRVVRHERTEEDWRKTKAAVCAESRGREYNEVNLHKRSASITSFVLYFRINEVPSGLLS